MSEASIDRPPRSFIWISILALLWNLAGLMAYLGQVMMTPDALAALPDAQRAFYANVPAWATSAFAIATSAGVIGSVLLLLRRSLALPLFVISLLGVLAQNYHAFFIADAYAVLGPSSIYVPVAVIVIVVALIVYAQSARTRGWLS